MAGKRKVATFALATSRAAFLLIVETNVLMLAKRISQLIEKKPDTVKKWWEKFGGNYDKLKKAVEKGKKHEWKKLSGVTIGSAAAVTAAITAALPLITSIVNLFAKNKSDKPNDNENDKTTIADTTTTIINDPTGTNTGIPVKTIDENKNYTKPLLIGGAVLVAGYFLMKKRK